MSYRKIPKELLASYFDIGNSKFERCLEPTMQCTNKPIRAHTVQNSRILDLLVENGHVISCQGSLSSTRMPAMEFKTVGRHSATTFTGLCSEHDCSIFAPIDTKELNFENDELLFYLAYRAVIFELHATMDAAIKIQAGYQKKVELGLLPEGPCPEGINAVERMMVSYETFCYRVEHFDKAYFESSYSLVKHDVLTFTDQVPTIAASSLFSLDKSSIGGDVVRVAINILPVSETVTNVVFSYVEKDASQARRALDRILNGNQDYQKYEISKTLLNYCENFVVAPRYFDAWSDHKKQVISDYFFRTILENDVEHEDVDLMLF